MRINVVLPEPFGPIKATFAPSPTRKETSFKSTRPSDSEYSTALTSMWPISWTLLRDEQLSLRRVRAARRHLDNQLYKVKAHVLERPMNH